MNVLILYHDITEAHLLRTMLSAGWMPINSMVATSIDEAVDVLAVAPSDLPYELAIVDLFLPDGRVQSAIEKLKSHNPSMEIVVVADKQECDGLSDDRLHGLRAEVHNLGAFWESERPRVPQSFLPLIQLLNRRRTAVPQSSTLSWCGFTLDLPRRVMTDPADKNVELPPRQWEFLTILLNKQGQIIERSTISNYLGLSMERKLVDVHMNKLRERLKPWHHVPAIITQRSKGYMALTDELFRERGGYDMIEEVKRTLVDEPEDAATSDWTKSQTHTMLL